MKTINLLNELNIKVLDNYQELLNTDFIFVPIKDEEKIIIPKNKKVLKGELLYSDDNIKRYSSISGKYMNIMEFNKQKFMVIKNDYQELSSNTRARNLDNVTKEKFMSLIEDLPLKNIFENKINTLYINSIDYKYEKLYPHKLHEGRNYYPDFTITNNGNQTYIEYYELSDKKYSNDDIEFYKKLILKKRELHKNYSTDLIELYSSLIGRIILKNSS